MQNGSQYHDHADGFSNSDLEQEAAERVAAPNLLEKFQEIIEYASCYLNAKLDRGKFEVKQLVWKTITTISMVFFAAATLLLSLAFLFYGVALGLAQVFVGAPWAGFVLTGLLFFAGTCGFFRYQKMRWMKKTMQRKINSYEQQLAQQQRKFGRNLEEQAAAFSQK